jgi:cardiolipin synthase
MRGLLRFSNLPNAITVARVALAPIVGGLILSGRWSEAFACFVAAGVSDGLDGRIARKYGLESDFGAMLDPIADKALMILVTWTLVAMGVLPLWFAALVTARDLLVVAGAWLAHRRTRAGQTPRIRPLFISKANTAGQIVLLGGALASKAFGGELEPWLTPTLVLAAALSVVSFGAYALRAARGEGIEA